MVRVLCAGICETDLQLIRGYMGFRGVLGHEFVGVVEEVGPGVKRFKPGDRVVTSFYVSCGYCALCRKGWFNECVNMATFGFGALLGGLGGGQAEYVVVPLADHASSLPDSAVAWIGVKAG